MPDLTAVLDLVGVAIECESDRCHENIWNSLVHESLINMALKTSHYAQSLAVKSLYVSAVKCMLCWTLDQDADTAFHPEKLPL